MLRKRTISETFLLSVVPLVVAVAWGQTQPPIVASVGLVSAAGLAKDPPAPVNKTKVGLVLEGGGALGLAHIGVLEWLEEHHIPVSYVAGTSMGGLVGGIYSTGRSAAAVKELFNSIHWDDVIRGDTPFKDLSFRRKEDARQVPTSLEFGLRK